MFAIDCNFLPEACAAFISDVRFERRLVGLDLLALRVHGGVEGVLRAAPTFEKNGSGGGQGLISTAYLPARR